MTRIVLLTMLAVALASPAGAEWNRTQRSEFTNDCVGACQTNPNVHPSRRGECATYCGCVMGEAEKFMSAADYDRLDKIARANGSDPKLDRFRAVFPVCNKRIFGE